MDNMAGCNGGGGGPLFYSISLGLVDVETAGVRGVGVGGWGRVVGVDNKELRFERSTWVWGGFHLSYMC